MSSWCSCEAIHFMLQCPTHLQSPISHCQFVRSIDSVCSSCFHAPISASPPSFPYLFPFSPPLSPFLSIPSSVITCFSFLSLTLHSLTFQPASTEWGGIAQSTKQDNRSHWLAGGRQTALHSLFQSGTTSSIFSGSVTDSSNSLQHCPCMWIVLRVQAITRSRQRSSGRFLKHYITGSNYRPDRHA